MDSLKGRGDALLHPTDSPQIDPISLPNEEDGESRKKKISRSKMKKVPEDSEEDKLGSKDDQGLSKLNSKPETMWGDDVLHYTVPQKDGQKRKKRSEFQVDPNLMTSDRKKNDDQQVPSTSRNKKVNEGSKDKKREGERFKGSADAVLHATGRKATGSLQLDPDWLPTAKDAAKKKKDPEASTINLSRKKKLLKGIEDEALESKVKKGSSKLTSKLGTTRRDDVLHANGRSKASSNKGTAEPMSLSKVEDSDSKKKQTDRKVLAASRVRKRNLEEDSDEEHEGYKAIRASSKLHELIPNFPLAWRGDRVLHSTKHSAASSDKKSTEPKLEDSDSKIKKNDPQVPSTNRATKSRLEEDSEEKKRKEKLNVKSQKRSGDAGLHSTGRKAAGSLQIDPDWLPKVKVAGSGKRKKDMLVSTINWNKIKKVLEGFEEEKLGSKVKKGSSKLHPKPKTTRRDDVLHANGSRKSSNDKGNDDPFSHAKVEDSNSEKKQTDRKVLSASRVGKRNLEEDSGEEHEGSKAIRASPKLHELIPHFPMVKRGDPLLHSTKHSAASSDKKSTEPKLEDSYSKKKDIPSTSRAKKRKLEEVSEEKKREEKGFKINPSPLKLNPKPQKRSIRLECKVEGCRHVARSSNGAVNHQNLHDKGYLLRCTECDHLFAERDVATKHVRHEHESNEYHNYLVGPPGTELSVPNSDGIFSCNQCQYTTPHLKHMKFHANAHRQGFTVRCEICYSLLSSLKALTAHKYMRHSKTEVSGDFCSEPNCDHKFRNTNARMQHLKIHQTGWDYRCTLCHEIFGCKGRVTAAKHCRKFHEGHPVSIIEVKDGVLPLQELLQQRILSKKSLSCDECNYQTTTDVALRWHIEKHRKGFQFACKLCHQLFQTELLSVKHLKNDHDVIIACNEEGCTFKTTDTARISRHKEAHRKGWVRQCEICNDVFSGKRVAIHHVRSKHPGSPLSVLKNPPHIPILKQDGGAPHKYKCTFCNSTFQSTESILKHLRAVHKKTSEELIGFNFETYEPNASAQNEGGCIYKQPLPGLGNFKSKFCFYANDDRSIVMNHNKIFHESELNKEKSSRLPKSEVEKAHIGHLKKTCGIAGCTFETVYPTWMRRHICGHGAGYPFECNLCHNVFALYGDARCHMTNSHSRKLDLTAISIIPKEKVLELMFAARELHQRDQEIRLNKHRTICMQVHMDILRKQMLRRKLRDPLYSGIVIKRLYTCSHCSMKTNTLAEILVHRSKNNCSKKLESQLEQAKRANERRKKMYGCTYPHCQYETDSSIAYRKHFSKHSIRAPVKCNVCCDIFESVAKCSQHSSAAHPKFVNTTRKALIFREPLEDLVCTACKPYDEFYHSTCFLLHTAMDHPEILPIEAGRIMTTFDADEFQDRRPPLPLREVDFNKKTSLVPADWMQVELDPLEFNYPCDQCDEMFYHPTCVDLHQKMAHRKQK